MELITARNNIKEVQQIAQKVIFRGLLKNAQMQGPRNPEGQELTNNTYLK